MLRSIKYLAAVALAIAITFLSGQPAVAGGVTTEGAVASCNPDDVDGNCTCDETGFDALTPIEQKLFLFFSLVFNSHDFDVDIEDQPDPSDPLFNLGNDPRSSGFIVDGVEGDAAGGCAAAPASLVAMFAGLLLFRRRRR